MDSIAKYVIALVALIHIYIMWFEMFAWKSRGPKVFGQPPELFNDFTKTMAANQGLYNGFLAAGLIWSLIASPVAHEPIAWFFLACVFIAGVYGAMTAAFRILYVQAVPAAIAGILLWLGL